MATWEDGPEYAPLERPDAFASPSVDSGLETPPPPPVAPPAPTERPVFADPSQAGPSLATLVPAPPDQRDPNRPFDVVSSVMTSDTSAWASAHWASPQSTSAPTTTAPAAPPVPEAFSQPRSAASNGSNGHAAPTSTGGFAPPTGAPSYPPTSYPSPGYPPPSYPPGSYPPGSYPPAGNPSAGTPPSGPGGQPFPPPTYPPANGPFPSPGTPQWFAPGGYQQQQLPSPATPTARAVLAAATPGVLITLVVGGFIWVLAPVTLVVAFVLSGRITYGRKVARTAFAAVLAFLGLVGLLSLVTADGLFTQWWNTVAGWACFGSWMMVVATTVAAYRALRLGRPDRPPTPRTSLR